MNMSACVMCREDVNVEGDEVEYDEEGAVWCSPCAIVESDTGEVY